MNKDKLAGVGIGIAIGAAIGITVGLLCAPQSGKETRQMMKQKAMDIKEKTAAAVGKIKMHGKSPEEVDED
jgi:gas vesicle protein